MDAWVWRELGSVLHQFSPFSPPELNPNMLPKDNSCEDRYISPLIEIRQYVDSRTNWYLDSAMFLKIATVTITSETAN